MFESAQHSFQLCFCSLFGQGRGFSFPCDGNGDVDLDRLSEAMRNNYLYARAMVGRDFQVPSIVPLATC